MQYYRAQKVCYCCGRNYFLDDGKIDKDLADVVNWIRDKGFVCGECREDIDRDYWRAYGREHNW